MQQGPRVSLYMVLIAIIAAIFSTFWTFGYPRLATRVRRYARSSGTAEAEKPGTKIQKRDVKRTLRNGLTINVVGMGAALLGLQAMVGMLVRRTHCVATGSILTVSVSRARSRHLCTACVLGVGCSGSACVLARAWMCARLP